MCIGKDVVPWVNGVCYGWGVLNGVRDSVQGAGVYIQYPIAIRRRRGSSQLITLNSRCDVTSELIRKRRGSIVSTLR